MLDQLISLWNTHSDRIVDLGYKGLLAVGILIACILIARAIKRSLRSKSQRLSALDPTLLPILSTSTSYAVYAIGAAFVLDIFGVNTASLIALMGAAGLAIGLALKDTLSNIAAGLMLLVLRLFRSGDFIEVGGLSGTVQEINLFTTILETPDGLYVASPNSAIWGTSITNYTRNGRRRLDIIVGVSYSDPIEAGLEVLRKIAAEEDRLLSSPAPQVMVAGMTDNAVNLQLRAWVTVDDYWQTYWDLNKRVKEGVSEAGLTIPFPQREIRMVHG